MIFKTDINGRLTTIITPSFGTDHLYGDEYQVGDVPTEATHFKNGAFLTQPAKPSQDYEWSDASFSWVLNLATAKTSAKDRITKARDNAESSGFMAYGKEFDSDAMAIQRISVAVQAANAVGESFSKVWTCKDNSTILLDYAQMIALPAIMADADNTLHIKARSLKDQIDTATTLEEINAVVW